MSIARSALILSIALTFASTRGRGDEPQPAGATVPAFGELSIQLSELKEPLWYPAPEGANRILTVRVAGGPVRAVWLAMHADSALRVMLSRTGREEFQINLYGRETGELVAGDDDAEEFRVFVETVDGAVTSSLPIRYGQRGTPGELDFPWDSASVQVGQRSCVSLPGSRGRIRLCVGDITAGQARVAVQANGVDLVPPASLRGGETLELGLAKARYVLTLDRMVNLLIGDDFAVFSLRSRDVWQRDEIERLLERVRTAPVTFWREEEEMGPAAFAAHLREKASAMGRVGMRAEDFIATVANRSWTTGNPYRVKRADGQVVETEGWLREQLAVLRGAADAVPAPAGATPTPHP